MSATVHLVDDVATLTNTFSVSGTATDPTTVSLTVTKPDGTSTTYTYAASEITKTSTGVYTKDVTCDQAGYWHAKWVGTGSASDVEDISWFVFPVPQKTLYATLEDFKSFASGGNQTLGTNDDLEMVGALHSASRHIDAFCNRRFYREGSAVARTYKADNAYELWVDDLATLTGLVVATDDNDDGTAETTWTITTDYVVEPTNNIAQSKPAYKIVAVGNRTFPTSGRRHRVSVTAEWGWPNIPLPVRQACLMLANRLFHRKDSFLGVAGSNEFGVLRVSRVDPDIEALLFPYRQVLV